MMNTNEAWRCRFEVCPCDEQIKNSFSFAGKITGVTDDLLSAIDQHKTVVSLIAATGDLQSSERTAREDWRYSRPAALALESKPLERHL